ncbi:hypothetical protein EDB86DRAFT_937136 [Lactarius hatsudake]|nr:hypothetical protein EDB86DRAFT_937136 [Lactarius hatsudake]
MSSDSLELICSVLTIASDEFDVVYENKTISTDVLIDEARNIIGKNRARLREAEHRYRLDDLLSAMLLHAPNSLGQRYVAICLHIAHEKGEDGVVNAAKAWSDNLLLPMLAIYKAMKTEPASSQTTTIDETMQHIESASRNDQRLLRTRVAQREQYRCAITKVFDSARVRKLQSERRFGEIPPGANSDMAAAHIVPFSLNKFNDKVISSPEITNAARTWDMLQSWTRIDSKTLVGSNINSPTNAIYMTVTEHSMFGRFEFYLEKEAYPDIPNKYKVRMARQGSTLSNGSVDSDVEFPTLEVSSVEPPNPICLKIHAAFAKVLHLCGAAEYIESVERDAETEGTLRLDGETDFASYLRSKIPIIVH